MYSYSYQEYINNLLGYNLMENNIDLDTNINTYRRSDGNSLDEYYPDIYKIVYPMVCKSCLYITGEITEELVENLTNEIYDNLEKEEMQEETRNMQTKHRNIRYTNNNLEEKRQRNFLLNDLIKILLLRELTGKNRPPLPPRPPMPPRPPRPPMGPGRPGERPPLF